MRVRLRKNNSYLKSPALQGLYSGMGLFLGNSELLVFQDCFAPVVPRRRSVSKMALKKARRLLPNMDQGFIICLFIVGFWGLFFFLEGEVCVKQ